MKTTIRIFSLIFFTAIFSSCMDKYTEVFTANSPIYMSYEDLRVAVKKSASRDLVNPGKIYFKDNYIFVVEEMKGIHIINAATPSSPVKEGFIEVPGCVDIAIKGSTLYADSYIDLVAVDVSNLSDIKEVSRVKDVFNYTVPPADNEYRMAEVDKDKGVVIDWEVKKVRQEIEYYYYPIYPMPFYKAEAMDLSNFSGSYGGAVGGGAGSVFGIGGSMARFGLYDDYLYTVDSSTLTMFDVTTPSAPKNVGKQNVGWQIETMFIYDDFMFFGTTNGMQIFSLKVPTLLTYVSSFWHATSCDPVVISDGYAYITLRGGRACNNSTINRLDVVKLSTDFKNNTLVASYPMDGPYGLGIDDEILFLCDGDAGLKVYNVADKLKINHNLLATFSNINTYDVIPVNGYLFMIGDGGFYLYDYSNLNNIRQIGFIPVVEQS